MNHTRKLRKIQIGNLPIYLGLSEQDIGDLVSRFMIDNFLADVGNTKPVLFCQHSPNSNMAFVELSSCEETNRILKLDFITLMDEKCRVQRAPEGNQPT